MNNTTAALNAGRVNDVSDSQPGNRYRLNDIYSQAWLSHAISAACKHKIPDAFGEGNVSAGTVARQCGLDEQVVYRVLRALAANGIFQQHGEQFAHNEASRILRSDHPYSWRGMALMWNHPSCLEGWKHFDECVKDGRSGIEHAFGKTLYEHLEATPGGTLAFSDAMISNSAHVSQTIAREFPFAKFKSVLDLGGGVGTLIAAIREHNPNLRGAVYEIAELEVPANQSLQGRAEVIVGNFLESVPSGFDLYLVKNSLWNWDDDNCVAIMGNVRTAIGKRDDARFVIIEYIIDPENARWTTLYDLQILNMPGGRARTKEEYASLLAQAKFSIESELRIEDQTLLIAKPN